ncbi:MAG: class I SAM-dependent methyltransferase [Acidobacteriaceae bacterium]|nr:class I SAM-dependent methyltransferase [Acidobacteriaceae bacterium]
MPSLDSAVRLLKNPSMIAVTLGKPPRLSNQEAACALLERSERDIKSFLNEPSIAEISIHLSSSMREKQIPYESDGWGEFLYAVVRATTPAVVVETGVFHGVSSTYILRAMELNGSGKLISIDLPATTEDVARESTDRMQSTLLPRGKGPGWIIPDSLRKRQELRLGDSKDLLPAVLQQPIDIFIHDSLHTFEHMDWEYRRAWPSIRAGGLLLSDDIFWNPAMHRFSKSVGVPYVQANGKYGGIRKP